MEITAIGKPPHIMRGLLLKTLQVMKLTATILLIGFLHVNAKSDAQVKITLNAKDAPLEKIFLEIQHQTGYVIWCNNILLEKAHRVSIKIIDASLDEALSESLKGNSLQYVIDGKIIVISEKNKTSTNNSNELQSTIIDVHGQVTDEDGKPVPGVTVTLFGTKRATSTNQNGEFVLPTISSDAKLIFTGANVEQYVFSVNGKIDINVKLKIKVNKLDQVQVIAYGTTTQRLSTGNISTVKGEDIEKQPVTNALLAIEGRVPGLQITQGSGISGTGVTIRVQGTNSIQGGNDPLIVVDGVPYSSQMLSSTTGGPYQILGKSGPGNLVDAGNGNPLNYLNPTDIENISILKDADATSIYGSRAANGAILITTKKGKAGKEKIDIDFQQGYGEVQSLKLKMLNTSDYLSMRHEALNNDGLVPDPSNDYDLTLWDTTRYTNWEKELIGKKSQYTNVNASISGGSAGVQYLVGTTYHRETTVFPSNFDDQKAAVHLNLNAVSLNQRFHFQVSANYMHDNNKLPQGDFTGSAFVLAPDAPALKSSDGSLNWAPNINGNSSWGNPLASIDNKYQSVTDNLITSSSLNYLILPGFTISASVGYNSLETKEFIPFPLSALPPEYRATSQRAADYTNSLIKSFILEPQINYKKQFAKNKINILIGSTIQKTNSDGNHLEGTGYITDASLKDIGSAAAIISISSLNSEYKYNAIFGRIEYNYNDKYILSISSRKDGSSRFGPANQFHNFRSIGAAWLFSEERLFKSTFPVMSFGKLKVSYGTTGNDQIGDYTYLNLYTVIPGISVPYQGVNSLAVSGLSNPYLQWEETKKASLGIDLGFFHDRLLLNLVYANNRSSNELLSYALPIIVGASSVTKNFPATIQNENWEFTLNSTNIKNNVFTWTTSLNLTIPKNKLISFPNLTTSTYSSTLIVGQPISVVKTFHFLGVNDTTGIYQFQSKSGPTYEPSFGIDNSVPVNTTPKYYGGIQNSFIYKKVQLDIFFQFVKQMGISYFKFGNPNNPPGIANNNQPSTVLSRWKKIGDKSAIERYNSDGSLYTQFLDAVFNSDASYTDASFIRLKNISFSYSMPEKIVHKMGLAICKIYFLAQNLLTFSKYYGIDPETQNTTLPPLRILTAGIHIGF